MTTSDILLRDLDVKNVSRRNACSEAMLTELDAAFVDAGVDIKVRIIVLAANGPFFCAGHDLKTLTAAHSNEDGGKVYFANVMVMCAAATKPKRSRKRQTQIKWLRLNAPELFVSCQAGKTFDFCSPKPAIPKVTTSPPCRYCCGDWPIPTPGGVPVEITSPACRLMN